MENIIKILKNKFKNVVFDKEQNIIFLDYVLNYKTNNPKALFEKISNLSIKRMGYNIYAIYAGNENEEELEANRIDVIIKDINKFKIIDLLSDIDFIINKSYEE